MIFQGAIVAFEKQPGLDQFCTGDLVAFDQMRQKRPRSYRRIAKLILIDDFIGVSTLVEVYPVVCGQFLMIEVCSQLPNVLNVAALGCLLCVMLWNFNAGIGGNFPHCLGKHGLIVIAIATIPP